MSSHLLINLIKNSKTCSSSQSAITVVIQSFPQLALKLDESANIHLWEKATEVLLDQVLHILSRFFLRSDLYILVNLRDSTSTLLDTINKLIARNHHKSIKAPNRKWPKTYHRENKLAWTKPKREDT